MSRFESEVKKSGTLSGAEGNFFWEMSPYFLEVRVWKLQVGENLKTKLQGTVPGFAGHSFWEQSPFKTKNLKPEIATHLDVRS